MESPRRKMIRLVDYDYSTNGAYFITICTKNKQNLFWDFAVGTTNGRPYGKPHYLPDEGICLHIINAGNAGDQPAFPAWM